MLIHKVVCFHSLGTIMILMSMCHAIQWTYDLEPDEANNRRIVHNSGEEKAQFRGKKQSPLIEKMTTAAPDDDEDKKTLAQQVADGKYGLIQTELFASPVKRPGILSYEINPEVPKDNVNNLGGLQPEEIWLAENHLLVLKGGGFNNHEEPGSKPIWPPIDNYIAPQRQVKIPPNPKVPPPFPVQLKDGGPIEFIRGVNGSGGPPPFFDPRFGPPPFLSSVPQEGNLKGILKSPGNFTEGNGRPPFPFQGPGIGLFPPAVAFLPPPGNFTELDEDDPSIYYPPPYDFIYNKDNSSHVPPGPLVPGIILPPPPNFFAAYEKTKPSQQSKSNPNLRKPSKSRPTQVHHEIHKIARPTKPPKPMVTTIHKSTSTTTSSTTTTPLPIITSDNTPNEIQPHTLPPNTPVGDWIPIPAPRPFYITGLKTVKPIPETEVKIRYDLPKNGWIFQNSTPLSNHKGQYIDPLISGWDFSYNQPKKGRHFTTTEAPAPLYTGFKPILVPQHMVTTTLLPDTNPYLPKYNNIKRPNEYYFYEEPQITENKFEDSNLNNYEVTKIPSKQYYDYPSNPTYETNTLSPPNLLDHVSVKNPSESGRVKQQSINYYEQRYLKPTVSTMLPSDYFYYQNEAKTNLGYSYKTPVGPTMHSSYQPQQIYNADSGQRLKLNNGSYSAKTTTEKPPVYEYSYSAPGYGSIEAPKVGINFATTPKSSVIFETKFSPLKDPPFSYFDYQSTPKSNIYAYEQTSTQPQYYSNSHSPSYEEDDNYHDSGVYTTSSPLTNVFHQQDMGLLDDITKKYFSLFGQKLNSDGLTEQLTTPLPPVQNIPRKQYYKSYPSNIPSTTERNRQSVKFPEDIYEIQSDQQYYSNPQRVNLQNYRQNLRNHKPSAQQNQGYPNYYRLSSPQYQPYNDYDQGLVHPNHPLDSDIRVNFKNPPPTIDPDAEFINPAYVRPSRPRGNSFISYQLPGSGGHFYFLTPQTIKPDNYLLNAGYRYQENENSGYFKRNTQSKPSRPRRTRPDTNSRKPLT